MGAERHPCLTSRSRFCNEQFLYPNPQKDSRGFISTVFNVVKSEEVDVLLPVTETTTMLITEMKKDLETYCSVPFPEFNAVEKASNKFILMKMAENLGVPIPRTFFLSTADELDSGLSACRSIGYPIVVKPSRSRYRTKNGWRNAGVQYANNEAELQTIIAQLVEQEEFPVLLQERIHGEGVGLFLCIHHQETVAAFSHRRLREKPPSGGVSVLSESIPLQKNLQKYSERLLNAMNWKGVAMVEFKKDTRTDEYKLMEINGRFWGSLQLAIESGVNFPALLVRMAAGEKIVPVREYKVGVKNRWLWGDLDVLLGLMFKTRKTLRLPTEYPGRWESFFSFMHFWGKDLHYEVFNRDDVGPWLFETRSRFFKD